MLLVVLVFCSLALAPLAAARDPEDRGGDRESLEPERDLDRDWDRGDRCGAEIASLEDAGWDDAGEASPDDGTPCGDPCSGDLPGSGGGAGGAETPDPGDGGDHAPGGPSDGPVHGGAADGVATAAEGVTCQGARADGSQAPETEPQDDGSETGEPASEAADLGPDAEDAQSGDDRDDPTSPDGFLWDPTGIDFVEGGEVGGDDDAWDDPTGNLVPMLNWSLYWVMLFLSGTMAP